jgi:general secretion pathway protein D
MSYPLFSVQRTPVLKSLVSGFPWPVPLLTLLMAMAPVAWCPAQAQAGAAATAAASASPGTTRPAKPGEPITLNFNNAEIEGVARTLGLITGRNMVVDPRVKGTMTLTSETPVKPAVAYEQFLSTLRLQGFTVVEADGLFKVVPEADAKLQAGPVSVSNNAGKKTNGNEIVTQIFKLNYENPNNLVPTLRPLISANNTINVNTGNNSLIITDYADNLHRLAQIIATLDVPNAGDVDILPLQHSLAVDVAPIVTRLLETNGNTSSNNNPNAPSGNAPTPSPTANSDGNGYRTTVIAEPRSNTLILRAANPARAALVRSLVAKLDQATPGDSPSGNIHVVYLKNAEATKLAITLRAALASAMAGTPGSSGNNNPGASSGSSASSNTPTPANNNLLNTSTGKAGLGTGASGNFGNSNLAQPSTGGQIQADPATNSLIISAPDPVMRQLLAVIDQLDKRRAQVLVESLIVEVNSTKLAQFGVQWQSLLGSTGYIGNTSNVTGANILALSATTSSTAANALSTIPPGLNLGYAAKVAGRTVLGALANFLQQNGDGNVLATPNLLTLDNEEARIIVGQNVPFVTGTYTTTATGSSNPFQTVDREDVGLTLRVKPQISENGTVKMAIYQEVSSIDTTVASTGNGPTTKKRAIETNVLVDDGNIVVLGGLLQDTYAGSEDKVPGLGDLPVVGNLFRSDNRTRTKTNLMIFLRPLVVRDKETIDRLTSERYQAARDWQESAQPIPVFGMPNIQDSPVMPPLTPTQAH